MRKLGILLSSLVFLLIVGDMARAQFPAFRGFIDYYYTYAKPTAPRTLTVTDPGGNDTFLFVGTGTLTSKSFTRPGAAGTQVTLGTCANGSLDQPSVDLVGRVVFSGVNSSCKINFSSGAFMMNPPACILTISGGTSTSTLCETVTTQSLTFVPTTAFASGDAVTWKCMGRG